MWSFEVSILVRIWDSVFMLWSRKLFVSEVFRWLASKSSSVFNVIFVLSCESKDPLFGAYKFSSSDITLKLCIIFKDFCKMIKRKIQKKFLKQKIHFNLESEQKKNLSSFLISGKWFTEIKKLNFKNKS
ncbi:hypothetical protein BpHYR1_048683 [Brachionus plicatilis]|uniref:Uncharacterized protein n=1 Tax=Brachionus plicatilis TaxID=10195 RepID=A0A3M7S546_BRAPC|nr:hypothetical protein BpHYR1_048683 [Brachionus plicatilis]